jgi:hypothetical protein
VEEPSQSCAWAHAPRRGDDDIRSHRRRSPAPLLGDVSTSGSLDRWRPTYTASAVANAATDESCCSPSVDLGNQYGDYEGIAAYGGIVRPVWTDRRQVVIDLGLREEVFTATLKP